MTHQKQTPFERWWQSQHKFDPSDAADEAIAGEAWNAAIEGAAQTCQERRLEWFRTAISSQRQLEVHNKVTQEISRLDGRIRARKQPEGGDADASPGRSEEAKDAPPQGVTPGSTTPGGQHLPELPPEWRWLGAEEIKKQGDRKYFPIGHYWHYTGTPGNPVGLAHVARYVGQAAPEIDAARWYGWRKTARHEVIWRGDFVYDLPNDEWGNASGHYHHMLGHTTGGLYVMTPIDPDPERPEGEKRWRLLGWEELASRDRVEITQDGLNWIGLTEDDDPELCPARDAYVRVRKTLAARVPVEAGRSEPIRDTESNHGTFNTETNDNPFFKWWRALPEHLEANIPRETLAKIAWSAGRDYERNRRGPAYRIKALVWSEIKDPTESAREFRAEPMMNEAYFVRQRQDSVTWWKRNFAGVFYTNSIAEAKAAAELDWQERIKQALEEV